MSRAASNISERRNSDDLPVSAYFHGSKRFYDTREHCTMVKIFAGDWYVTKDPGECMATILGSCVAACIRDPILGIGGMNHFLLPGEDNKIHTTDAARYGVYAMESLLNGIFSLGGRKERLEVKVFGGGNVINNSAKIGSKNARFVRDFLRTEGYRIMSEDLEGTHPRRVHYYPATGKVMMRLLRRKDDMQVVEEEALYTREIVSHPVEGNIELF